jgi:hypothetical protein
MYEINVAIEAMTINFSLGDYALVAVVVILLRAKKNRR